MIYLGGSCNIIQLHNNFTYLDPMEKCECMMLEIWIVDLYNNSTSQKADTARTEIGEGTEWESGQGLVAEILLQVWKSVRQNMESFT